MATTTHFGQTARATKFKRPTKGAEHIAVVTPATVRMRPCTSKEKYIHG